MLNLIGYGRLLWTGSDFGSDLNPVAETCFQSLCCSSDQTCLRVFNLMNTWHSQECVSQRVQKNSTDLDMKPAEVWKLWCLHLDLLSVWTNQLLRFDLTDLNSRRGLKQRWAPSTLRALGWRSSQTAGNQTGWLSEAKTSEEEKQRGSGHTTSSGQVITAEQTDLYN